MKKIIAIILLFVSFSTNIVSANIDIDSMNIEDIKKQQEELKYDLYSGKIINQEEIITTLDKLADFEVMLAKLEGRIISLSTNSPTARGFISRNNLSIGDIIVLKPKEPRKFASFFSAGWQHA
ncbi:MAG: hypothetical protein Q4A35_03535 [Candidatus Gracilibacteria bacterium]|nr:hypothetical protein [Candidatus Gracilibacteria bacterium]